MLVGLGSWAFKTILGRVTSCKWQVASSTGRGQRPLRLQVPAARGPSGFNINGAGASSKLQVREKGNRPLRKVASCK